MTHIAQDDDILAVCLLQYLLLCTHILLYTHLFRIFWVGTSDFVLISLWLEQDGLLESWELVTRLMHSLLSILCGLYGELIAVLRCSLFKGCYSFSDILHCCYCFTWNDVRFYCNFPSQLQFCLVFVVFSSSDGWQFVKKSSLFFFVGTSLLFFCLFSFKRFSVFTEVLVFLEWNLGASSKLGHVFHWQFRSLYFMKLFHLHFDDEVILIQENLLVSEKMHYCLCCTPDLTQHTVFSRQNFYCISLEWWEWTDAMMMITTCFHRVILKQRTANVS